MATPPSLRRVSVEDYSEAPEWFKRFLTVLNPFLTDTAVALTGGLDAINLRRQTHTLTLTTEATLANTFTRGKGVLIANRLGTKPTEVRIGQIYPKTSGDALTAAVGLPVWELTSDNLIKIKYIGGLNVSCTYDITLVIE